jgi:hypothetical protein
LYSSFEFTIKVKEFAKVLQFRIADNIPKANKREVDFSKLTDEEVLSHLKTDRPFDHKKGRMHHYLTVEKGGYVFLFDGRDKLIQRFEVPTFDENFSEKLKESKLLNFRRNIRQFALNHFLNGKDAKVGGFLFN